MKYIIYIWYIFLCTWNIVHQFWVSSLKIIFDHSFLSINNQFFWHNFVLLQVRQRCYFSISGSGYGFQFLMAALQTTTTVFIPLQYHTMICTYIYASLYWCTLPESFLCSDATAWNMRQNVRPSFLGELLMNLNLGHSLCEIGRW